MKNQIFFRKNGEISISTEIKEKIDYPRKILETRFFFGKKWENIFSLEINNRLPVLAVFQKNFFRRMGETWYRSVKREKIDFS